MNRSRKGLNRRRIDFNVDSKSNRIPPPFSRNKSVFLSSPAKSREETLEETPNNRHKLQNFRANSADSSRRGGGGRIENVIKDNEASFPCRGFRSSRFWRKVGEEERQRKPAKLEEAKLKASLPFSPSAFQAAMHHPCKCAAHQPPLDASKSKIYHRGVPIIDSRRRENPWKRNVTPTLPLRHSSRSWEKKTSDGIENIGLEYRATRKERGVNEASLGCARSSPLINRFNGM